MLCIKDGIIHDAIHRKPYEADILVDQKKIIQIGKNLSTEGCEILDAKGLHIYPGFVEAHCHVGLSVYGAASAGKDVNESNDPLTPHLRAIDGVDGLDPAIEMAAKAGVTCAATGPGSANPMGGTFLAMKTWGHRVDDMVLKTPIAMKCALGENPKNCYGKSKISSRMTVAAMIRDILARARIYMDKIDAAKGDPTRLPPYDQKLESLLPVMRGEIPLKVHAHQVNDIFTAMRIAEEFDLKLTLEHVTEGHFIAEELAQAGYPLAVGPSFSDASKIEFSRKSWTTAGILAKAGCQVSIVTDSPVVPLHYLPLCAGFAIKAGMDPFDALRAITINPARHIGVADRVGSLEVGKDADIVVVDGSPFSIEGRVCHVLIDGRKI